MESTAGDVNGMSSSTVLWHGWLRKLGRFNKRWRRRYFVFVALPNGTKELRHFRAQQSARMEYGTLDVATLMASTPKNIIQLTDATGICCFTSPSSPSPQSSRRATAHDNGDGDAPDQKFGILTPQHVYVLSFLDSRERRSEAQQGMALLASLSTFFPKLGVLHSGFMTKRWERTMHSAKNIISYWKRHYFVLLSSGDLLYFRDDMLNEFQGRVDVRHAPTVRVTGERFLEDKKLDFGGVLKFSKTQPQPSPGQNCLVWIATPPSKMFVIKVQEDHEGAPSDSKHHELTQDARKWISFLIQGHAETKYTQLEQCISTGKFAATPEIMSAVKAGIPDELRGQLWKGFSGAAKLQTRAEINRSIRVKKQNENADAILQTRGDELFEELSRPLDTNQLHRPENQIIVSRLLALAVREAECAGSVEGCEALVERDKRARSSVSAISPGMHEAGEDDIDSDTEEMLMQLPSQANLRSLKQLAKTKMGDYLYPSDVQSPGWETYARRCLLIACSRFNPYSHPCPWRVSSLLLAYLDEESAFWVINSIFDTYLPGYYHGYRPALQVDVTTFDSLLNGRKPALYAHLKTLAFPLAQIVERWFLTLFTSTLIPVPTVLRVWDAFFVQGSRILFGVGIALLLSAEEKLFRAKTTEDALEALQQTERSSIDADSLFLQVFSDDWNITWLPEDSFDKLRAAGRQNVLDFVSQNIDHFKEKLDILAQLQDCLVRARAHIQRFQSALGSFDHVGDQCGNDAHQGSIVLSLQMLVKSLEVTGDAISELATDLNHRQTKWVALSSQVNACPLGSGSSAEGQSWLSQVKQGKVSGAGCDSIPADGQLPLALGHSAVACLADGSGLLLDNREVGAHERKWSWLMTESEDFALCNRFRTESFLTALETAMQAAFAAHLDCLASRHRFVWHSSTWLHSSVDFPNKKDRAYEIANLRNAPSARKAPGDPIIIGEEDLSATRRNSLDDTALRRKVAYGSDEDNLFEIGDYRRNDDTAEFNSGMEGNVFGDNFPTSLHASFHVRASRSLSSSSSTQRSLSITSSRREQYKTWTKQQLTAAAMRCKESEHVLQLAVETMMNSLSRWVRLESGMVEGELYEFAAQLEDHLHQSYQRFTAQIAEAQELC